MSFDPSLVLVLRPGVCADMGPVETVRRAVSGGVTAVLLCQDDLKSDEFEALARELAQLLTASPAVLILKEALELARDLGVGVHLDTPEAAVTARADLGSAAIVGLSLGLASDVPAGVCEAVSYLCCGPLVAAPGATGGGPLLGFDGLARLAQSSAVPVIGAGGLRRDQAAFVVRAGGAGLAVCSAICGRPDPARAARVLAHGIREARKAGTV